MGVGAGRSAPGSDSTWVLNLSYPTGMPSAQKVMYQPVTCTRIFSSSQDCAQGKICSSALKHLGIKGEGSMRCRFSDCPLGQVSDPADGIPIHRLANVLLSIQTQYAGLRGRRGSKLLEAAQTNPLCNLWLHAHVRSRG